MSDGRPDAVLYVLLSHDLKGLGRKGERVSKEAFDAFVREQNDGVARFLRDLRAREDAP